ncbi:MAG: SpoIIE family protein phosphatase [Lachnospiraceae bacterium]|nr:SpoIIE family protein phosphatase [Lachnospiraceae bacterium]
MRRDDVIEWKMQNDMKRRLSGIAGSFRKLSGSISDFADIGTQLKRDMLNGLFDEVSMKLCADCVNCNRCWVDEELVSCAEVSELLDAVQTDGGISEEMERRYFARCEHRHRMFDELKQGLFRLKQGMLWRNRLNESREAVANQLTEMARIVGEFAGNLEQDGSRAWPLPRSITVKLWLKNIRAKQLLMLERGDGSMEIHLTARNRRGRCVTTKEAAMILSCLVGEKLVPCEDSRNVIGKEYADYVFREDANFQVITGVARAARADSRVSGDNFSFLYPEGDEVIMLLSDGMGSGEAACRESERVIELLEQFLEAGFKEEAAMKLINSMLVLREDNTMFTTMDVCVLHLATGVCEFMKAGAAATYILRGDWMESIHSTTLPAGVLLGVSCDVKQKKLYDGDYVIMLSDGVIEGEDGGEEFLRSILAGAEDANPQEIANLILEAAMQREQYRPKDDMTVLVAGLFQRVRGGQAAREE